REEAREIASTLTTSAPHTHHPPPLITTLHLPPPPLPFIHLSPLLPQHSSLLSPLRSPLLPCAHLCSPALHLCSPALTSAPLRSPLLPCTHLCSPALTSAPLHSPLLFLHFSHHRFPVPLFTATVSPSPTVHGHCFPVPKCSHHCFSVPRCSHHGFFPTVHPPFVPSVPSVHPSAIPACSPCSPHSLAMLPPPTHSLPETSSQHSSLLPALTSAPLRSPLLPCAHLCSPALTSAPLRSPLLPCAHLCSPALTSAPLHSSLLPCAHLCSPAVTSAPPALTSAPLRSPLLPCAHLCSPALTSAPLRSPLLPCTHLCSPALTSAPLHSPLLPALTFTVHPLFTPPFPPSQVRSCHSSLVASLPPPPPLPSLLHMLSLSARGEREVEHVSGGELQRFAVGVVGGQLGDRHLHVWEREVEHLSGGELQRFAIGVVAGQLGDIYMFDEPSSYLDVRQRLKAAQVIRSLLRPDRYVIVVERDLSVLDYLSHFMCCLYGKPGAYRAVFLRYHPMHPLPCHSLPIPSSPSPPRYVIVVEHDLSVLDYLSDFICCLYGKPGAYGVVTLPFSVREGINIFLAGFVPTENLRFRDESLTFRGTKTPVDNPEEGGQDVQSVRYRYLGMIKKHGGFNLLLPLPHSILSPPFIPSQVLKPRWLKPRWIILKKPRRTRATIDNPEEAKTYTRYKYPRMVKKQGGFKLTVEPGDFTDSQIVVMLGENGTGKTTFIRMLVGKLSLMGLHVSWLSLLPVPSMIHLPSLLSPFQAALSRPDQMRETGKEAQGFPEFNASYRPQKTTQPQAGLLKADPDEETGKEAEDLPEFNVSYKPQKISRKFPLSYPLRARAAALQDPRLVPPPQFNTDVLRPMQIDPLLDQEVVNLSGGELQRVAITLCLGKVRKEWVGWSTLSWRPGGVQGGLGRFLGRLRSCPMQIDPLLDQEVVKISGGELQRVAITLCLGKKLSHADRPPARQEVVNLSGGELQRVAISLCLGKVRRYFPLFWEGAWLFRYALGRRASAYLDSEQRIVAAKPADIYLIDEPSAYLDSEQRIVAAKVIKRFILHAKKDGVCGGARLHHGHVPGGPRHRVRGAAVGGLHGAHGPSRSTAA
ncbi:unnamed protein product, partial [Closterium sp. NIES-65]